MGAREMMYQGSSRVVGDGRSVKFWDDKWLKNLSRGRLMSRPPSEHTGVLVSD